MKSNSIIVFPTDLSTESLNALDYAIDYARKTDSTLTLVNVIEYPWRILNAVTSLIEADVFNRKEIANTTRLILKKITARIKKENSIKVNYKILYGNLFRNLIKYIETTKSKMMIVGSSGTEGKISYRLADKASISVITIHNNTDFNPIKNILFPISNKRITTKKLNEIVRVCKIYNADITLLGIADNEKESLEEMSLYMENLLGKLEAKNIKTKISMRVDADYPRAIKNYSVENNIDLISVVSNTDHGIMNLFNITPDEILVKESEIPVLNIAVETDAPPKNEIITEYISPWSMRYDENRIFIPLKKQ